MLHIRKGRQFNVFARNGDTLCCMLIKGDNLMYLHRTDTLKTYDMIAKSLLF